MPPGDPLAGNGGPQQLRLEERLAVLEARLPKSNVISPRFWTRALAIWGHQLAIIGIIYAGLMLVAILILGVGALLK